MPIDYFISWSLRPVLELPVLKDFCSRRQKSTHDAILPMAVNECKPALDDAADETNLT